MTFVQVYGLLDVTCKTTGHVCGSSEEPYHMYECKSVYDGDDDNDDDDDDDDGVPRLWYLR